MAKGPISDVNNPPMRWHEAPVRKEVARVHSSCRRFPLSEIDINRIHMPSNAALQHVWRPIVMTSSHPTAPKFKTFTDGKGKYNSQPGSPVSHYESSPERVTKQNQLLQPALLPRPSRASSEVNITEIGGNGASEACSKSENNFPPPDRVPQEITQLKAVNSKRMNWVKLIRLQLNALHEKKSKGANLGKSAAMEAKTTEAGPHDTSPVRPRFFPLYYPLAYFRLILKAK